jgi:TolB-like protein/DNA-binding winged helix-turn-helix (wHTH) protein/Tfp pilus assembly protein PilF
MTGRSFVFRFADIEVREQEYVLVKAGEVTPVEPKAFRVLLIFLRNPQKLIPKEELLNAVWGDAMVTENSLTRCIALLRKMLEDDTRNPRYIETVATVGYRFIAEVKELDQPTTPSKDPPDIKPRQSIRVLSALFGMMLLLVGIGAFWRFSAARKSAPAIRSLAVLPLDNLSNDPEQEFFADGMTDELITNLAQIHALRVISRSSVMQFKRTKMTLPEIAQTLKVDAIVEGSVARSGNNVHITAQLLDARQDRHLWAATYERQIEDVLALQTQIARAIADQVKVNLTPAEDARLAKSRRTNSEAYDALLQGRFLHNKRAPAATQKALAYFQNAVAIDPGSADAWASLGDCYSSLGGDQGIADPNSVRTQAREALEKALQLDPDLAEAHSSMGWYKMWYDWDSAGAERELLRGIELSPNNSAAHRYYAFYLRIRRRFDEALEQNNRAMDLSPLDILPQSHLAGIYAAQGKPDKVMEQANRVLEIDPNFTGVYKFIAGVCEARHQWPEAYAALEHIKDTYRTAYLRGIADVAATSGDMPRAEAAMAELKEYARHNYVSPLAFASYEARFGDRDRAFGFLDKGYREHATGMIYLDANGGDPLEYPTVTSFTGSSFQLDPRFQDLVRRVGFR